MVSLVLCCDGDSAARSWDRFVRVSRIIVSSSRIRFATFDLIRTWNHRTRPDLQRVHSLSATANSSDSPAIDQASRISKQVTNENRSGLQALGTVPADC